MPSGIDHVVIAVPDPDAAATELTETVGLAFTAGGRHAGLGTFNRIAFLGDAYLELMGVDNRDEASGWAIGAAAALALGRGGGFATWGLVDPAIRTSVPSLQANGSHIGPLTHGSRERPDGEMVEWWTATPPQLGPDQPPFLIKHLDAGAEWGAEALVARRRFVHPIGGPVSLLGLRLAVSDPVSLGAACLIDVALEFQAIGPAAVATVGHQAVRLVQGAAPGTGLSVTLGIGGLDQARTVASTGVEFALIPATR